MRRAIRFTVNGRPVEVDAEPGRLLLWVLRSDLGLTGTKYGCGERECGACTVLVDGRPVFSCRQRVGSVEGREVTTVEGVESPDGTLHPVQEALVEHGGLQCGFCTPGMVMRAVGFLRRNPDPAREDIARGMQTNLCRCGTYNRIVDAVEQAARELRAQEDRP